jgi:hypothetical protein
MCLPEYFNCLLSRAADKHSEQQCQSGWQQIPLAAVSQSVRSVEFPPSQQNITSTTKIKKKINWELYPFPKIDSRGNESIPNPARMKAFLIPREEVHSRRTGIGIPLSSNGKIHKQNTPLEAATCLGGGQQGQASTEKINLQLSLFKSMQANCVNVLRKIQRHYLNHSLIRAHY